MGLHNLSASTCGQFPDTDSIIVASGEKVLARWVKDQSPDPVVVADLWGSDSFVSRSGHDVRGRLGGLIARLSVDQWIIQT